VEIRKIAVEDQLRQNFFETPLQPIAESTGICLSSQHGKHNQEAKGPDWLEESK
jgi:hypothetical protein